MNKFRYVFLVLGLLLFLFTSFNSYESYSILYPTIPSAEFSNYLDNIIRIPFYNWVTILCAMGSILFLFLAVIGMFKKIPDLTEKNESYRTLLDGDSFDS